MNRAQATPMPLHPCRECRHAVSTEALACPSCGAAHPAGASAALAVREPGGVVTRDGDGDGPTPAFWRAVRMLLNRVRIGLYGLASALFAALLTGSLVRQPTGWVLTAGVLMSMVLCLAAVLLELVDLNLGKGKS
ncbi:hypothetical protein [Longimicrobium sp.]|uniref:hypothetical protein n=1 Tax=Longimicrobium sp. TaxID=2029185 RepID=UPI002E2FC739|nr:hypothetical protein [Longimicrobium sp.]HEX6039604.1 hypothetical protein [Longimicrobium sp.]